MPDQIFVIGHVNPDTDSIAAARAGALNPQTAQRRPSVEYIPAPRTRN